MKRIALCVAACMLLTGLSGCGGLPEAREPADTLLMRVLGVDYSGDKVTFTAVSGTQNLGEQAPVILTASGATAEEAMMALEGAGEGYVSLVYVTQIILGSGTPPEAVLTRAINEKRMGQTTTVWVAATGTAKDLINQMKGGAERLASIEVNTEVKTLTVLEALASLYERKEIQLPQLTVANDTLTQTGYVTVREDEWDESR